MQWIERICICSVSPGTWGFVGNWGLGPRHELNKKCNWENEGRLMRRAIIKAILTNKLTVYLITLTVHNTKQRKLLISSDVYREIGMVKACFTLIIETHSLTSTALPRWDVSPLLNLKAWPFYCFQVEKSVNFLNCLNVWSPTYSWHPTC